MSHASNTLLAMDDGENYARLAGLLATIALPMIDCDHGLQRKRVVEIEYRRGRWEEIDGVEMTAMALIFWRGRNGSRIQFTCPATRCPLWRVERQPPQRFESGDPRREWLER